MVRLRVPPVERRVDPSRSQGAAARPPGRRLAAADGARARRGARLRRPARGRPDGARPLVPGGGRQRLAGAYLETFRAHRRRHAATRTPSPGWPASARSTCRGRRRLRRGPHGPRAAVRGTPIEEVEAILDGFATGSRDAAAGHRRSRSGRCCARCGRTPGGRRSPTSSSATATAASSASTSPGPEDGFPPDRVPAAIALLTGGAHRTIHAGEASGLESIRPPWTAPAPSGSATASVIDDEVHDDGTLGPVAQRVRDSGRPSRSRRRPTCRPARPVAGRAPHRPAPPARLRRHRQHRQPADERRLATSEMYDVATTFRWTWTMCDRHGARPRAAAFADDANRRARLLTDVVRPASRRWRARPGVTAATPCGNTGWIGPLLRVCRQSPVILPDGPSGHERIRAGRRVSETLVFRTASEDADRRRRA